jgi:KipI family sensor histidine kinase inhibitor
MRIILEGTGGDHGSNGGLTLGHACSIHRMNRGNKNQGGEFRVNIIPASDSSLLVVLGQEIDPALQRQVLALFDAVRALQDSRVRNLHPAYASLLIDFDPLLMIHEELAQLVESVATDGTTAVPDGLRIVEIPVCYDPDFGPDIGDVAAHNNISPADVVRLHSSATYFVGFLGFTAGFAYMGGLPRALHTPRLTTPRRMVAAGTVGIAGGQTGIYPAATPGGWRLIGCTPIRMFNPQALPPSRLQPGDSVRFSVIDRAEFDRLQQEQG